MMTFEIYQAIETERRYQDAVHGTIEENPHTVGEFSGTLWRPIPQPVRGVRRQSRRQSRLRRGGQDSTRLER